MRHLILLFIAATLVVTGCQKEVNQGTRDQIQDSRFDVPGSRLEDSLFINQVKLGLKDSISGTDLSALDFSKLLLSTFDNGKILLLRIPFRGKLISNDFVLLQTDVNASILRGRIVHIDGQVILPDSSANKVYTFNGTIQISSLQRNVLVQSDIVNGYIQAFHPGLRTDVLPGEVTMPEVVMVCTINSNDTGVSWSEWMYLLSAFNDFSYTDLYNNLDGSGGSSGGGSSSGGSGGSTGASNTGISSSPTMQIDYDTYVGHPALDVSKYLNCFGSVPDAGATCSITLYTDIPVNGDPSKFFNWKQGSPGHTFLSFNKSNAGQSVQQIFGWYPSQSWEAVTTTAPIPGKFVDDGEHEYNASFKVNLSPQQLQDAITEVSYLARFIQYDIDEYNCTDFALQVFNTVRSPTQQLEIPMYDIPGGQAPYGTATPNGVYQKLEEMKAAGGADGNNITIPVIGWVGDSKGPCQ